MFSENEGTTGSVHGVKKWKRPELLAPAGSPEVLRVAVNFGADAVYFGGEDFGLRAKAKNFSPGEIREGIDYARSHSVKAYVTVNIFAHNEDLAGIRSYLGELAAMEPDALIISDPGVFSIAREVCPQTDIHISTQAGCTNYGTCRFWHGLGAGRVVAARELSLEELKEMRLNMPEDMELEVFVHGAMCVSQSGRCLLSSYFTGRDANRGECTHPCRWKYAVVEETRPGQYLPVIEEDGQTYVFNAADLCMIGHLPELMDCGIDSFKIEGRMKNALYAASVTRAYRQAIDDCMEDPARYSANISDYMDQLRDCTYRKFSTGFYFGKPDEKAQIYESNTYEKGCTFLGIIGERTRDGSYRIEQKNKFSVGETVEIMKPDGENIEVLVKSIRSEDGEEMESAPHPRQILYVDLGHDAEPLDILRRRENTQI